LDQRRSQDVTFHSRYEVYSHSGTRRANFPCASASRMRSLRNDKHGYVFVASQDAEQVECDLLFTICTQPRCEARPETGPTMQPTTTTLLPHNLADPGEASPAFLPCSNTDRKLSTCRCTRPLTCMMPSRPRNQSCRRVLPFHALRPCNMQAIQGADVWMMPKATESSSHPLISQELRQLHSNRLLGLLTAT
jgi:hypothetical protein